LNSETVDEYVDRMVAACPPLTEAQRSKLAELLRPVRRSGREHSKVAAA
jgi:hypothetical protein